LSDNPAPGQPQPDPGTLSIQRDPGLLDPAQTTHVPGHNDADDTGHNAVRQRARTTLGQKLYEGKEHDFLRKIDTFWRKIEESFLSGKCRNN
jgi:hypothetical protein